MAEIISDKELRQQLLEYGDTNIGPITSTTRALYLKKLNHHRARNKQHTKRASSKNVSKKLLGFSSDESGDEAGSSSRVSTRRRARSTKTVPKQEAGVSVSVPMVDSPSSRRSNLRRRGIRSSTRVAVADDNNKYNDEDIENIYSPQHSFAAAPSPRDARSFNMQTSLNTTYSLLDNTQDSIDSPSRMPHHHEKVFESSDSDLDPVSLDFDSGPSTSQPINVTSYSRSQPKAEYNHSSYRSVDAISKSYHNTNDTQKDKHGYTEEDNIKKHGFKTTEEPGSKFAQYISMFLLVLAAMFFLCLAFMYLTMKSNIGDEDTGGAKLLLYDDPNLPKMDMCSMSEVRPVIHEIAAILRYTTGQYECGYMDTGPELPFKELKAILQAKLPHQVNRRRTECLLVALALIAKNPQWKIKFYDDMGVEIQDSVLDTFNWTSPDIFSYLGSLKSEVPDLSLWCRLQKSVGQVLNVCALLVVGALIVTSLMAFVRWRWRKKEQETAQIYDLVEKIINILRNHSEAVMNNSSLQPYLAIPHVRDMLIPPQQRRRQQALWDKACRFLSANESRVRVETQKIEGEEFAVWRWLQQTHTNGSKVWQGQACGEKESSMILPKKIHTQCLKVRNMFDLDIEYGEDWHISIQDAILEKCGPNHGIVHIAVDKASREGCVFLKCNSSDAAGEAFRSLQAWWFDGKLVTVKFLRLNRYHERFPDSTGLTAPIQPSNDSCSSLSQPFHKSIIESS